MKIFYQSLLFSFLLLSACSNNTMQNDSGLPPGNQPLMSLSSQLAKVSKNLTGTLFIYNTSDSSLLFKEAVTINDSGVSSPAFTLERNTEYRFVLIFYWKKVAIAYVDTTQTTQNDDSTTITFTDDMIVYTGGTASKDDELITADISAGVLPDLDIDDDTYSNFIEIKAGTEVDDPKSKPSGPSIDIDKPQFSANGNLHIHATITDGLGIENADLSFVGANYLTEAITSTLSGSSGDTTREFDADFNSQYAPLGTLTIVVTATNLIDLTNSAKTTVEITDENNGENLGPIIDFESVSKNEILSGTVSLAVRAYDHDGVQSIVVDSLNGLGENSSNVGDRFSADWYTTEAMDGPYVIHVTATDNQNVSSTASLSVTVLNSDGLDHIGPDLQLEIYQSNNTAKQFYYQNGDAVYGKIQIRVLASDPSDVDSLAFINGDSFDSVLGNPTTATATTYINTIDTTQLSDGEWQLEFLTSDKHSNRRDRVFSVTIANHPAIQSFTVNNTNSVTLASGEAVHLSWSTQNADSVSISNATLNQSVLSGLDAIGETDFVPENFGTYRLTATRTTNKGTFTGTADVTIALADTDLDGILNGTDNCATVENEEQTDTDHDGLGDVCDDDIDNDGVLNEQDALPYDATETVDTDQDGVGDNKDNCPNNWNYDQKNIDGDTMGDTCDDDIDGDSVKNSSDDFPTDPTETTDSDDDGIGNNVDTCQFMTNPLQGVGDWNPCDDYLFAGFISYDAGGDIDSMFLDNFDDDNIADLVLAEYDHVSFMKGDADGTFEAPKNYYTTYDFTYMNVGDFDHDGDLDLVTINGTQTTITILLGDGHGVFSEQRQYRTGNSPSAVAVGYSNQDLFLDLIVVNGGDDNVSIFLGNGDGTFNGAVNYTVGDSPVFVAVGDIDNNGIDDLVVTNYSNIIFILFGDGSAYSSPVNFTVPNANGIKLVNFGYLNDDEYLDLVTSSSSDISVFLNQKNGTFATNASYHTSFWNNDSLIIEDVNKDGYNDLAVNSNGWPTFNVNIALGNGDGSFKNVTSSKISSSIFDDHDKIAFSDVNQDNEIDLVVSTGSVISVIVGHNGIFLTPTSFTYNTVGRPHTVAVGDLNGDKIKDLAVAGEDDYVSVLLGNGDGSFQSQLTYGVGNTAQALAIGDFNQDTFNDLVVANKYDNNISVLMRSGDTFSVPVNYNVGKRPTSIVVGKFNDDIYLDLAVTNSTDNTVSVLLGKEDGTFTFNPAINNYGTGSSPAFVITGNLNITSDQYLDLVVINSSTVSILLGKGDGTFYPSVSYSTGASGSFSGANGDLDNDGDLDLVIGSASGDNVFVLYNNGNGTFQTPVSYFAGNKPAAVAIGDVNKDTINDLVVQLEGSEWGSGIVSVMLGKSGGGFELPVNYKVEAGIYSAFITLEDIDGDTDLDLISASLLRNSINIIFNNTNP